MSHTAEVSRSNPMCIIFLVDQSGSMGEPFGKELGKLKCEGVADAINELIDALINSCTKQGEVLDRYYVGVIGYGNNAASLLRSNSGKSHLVKISELADSPLRTETRSKRSGGSRVHEVIYPVWFEPIAGGETHMREAIDLAETFAKGFILEHPDCRPPIVFNITDGAPHELATTEKAAEKLRALSSRDGEVLMFNIHISHLANAAIEFPTSERQLPDSCARLLFRMSSIVPASMVTIAKMLDFQVESESRGFVFNASLDSVIRFIAAGTRATQQRKLGYTP